MKRIILLSMVSFFIVTLSFGQNEENKKPLFKNIDATIGYLPKKGYNALTFNGAINNILLDRVGFYTTFQFGLDSDYFSNFYGVTVAIIPIVYVYGGLDMFTKHGLFQEGTHCRKELGVGVYPYKQLTAKLGYSGQAGVHFGIGWQFRLPEKK